VFRLRFRHRSSATPALPLEPDVRRSRNRRGGPRTPLPLLPIIAIAAGIGIAYVSQSAHATKATYQLTTLQAQQQQLVSLDQQLGDELARLQSSERIVAAAQQLGMKPASHWTYVETKPQPVWPSSQPATAASHAAAGGAWQQLVGALAGAAR